MRENKQCKQLSLSDLIRNPNSVVEDFNELPDDDDAEYVKEYGIGMDCHSRFIEVCIRYRNGKLIQKSQATFSTQWKDLVAARDWCIAVLKTKANPTPDLSEPQGTPGGIRKIRLLYSSGCGIQGENPRESSFYGMGDRYRYSPRR